MKLKTQEPSKDALLNFIVYSYSIISMFMSVRSENGPRNGQKNGQKMPKNARKKWKNRSKSPKKQH